MPALTVLNAGRRLLVRWAGELSETTVPALEQQLSNHLAGTKSVLLDLSNSAYANSAGLRWLVRMDGGLRAQQRHLRILVRSGSRVERALSLTGYDRLVDLRRSGRDAWR